MRKAVGREVPDGPELCFATWYHSRREGSVSSSGAIGQTPEQKACAEMDRLLSAAGWDVSELKQPNIDASRGVTIRNFTFADGYGFADYLLHFDAKAAGVIEGKRQGATLSGVETQEAKCSKSLPGSLPARKPTLPFLYGSIGAETHFTCGLEQIDGCV
jgi:type I restriction enzyme R subunit